MIMAAKKPLLISGGGVRYSEAGEAVMEFCKEFNIPVSQTQAGHSALPDSFELSVGGVGVTGGLAANLLAKDADLVIGIGTRFNDFVTGSKWVLFRNPDIKVLAINTSEFHAEKVDAVRCVGDAKVTVEELTKRLKEKGYKSGYTTEIQKIKCALIRSSLLTYTGRASKSVFMILKFSSISHRCLLIFMISRISLSRFVITA